MGKDPGIEIRNFEALAGMSGLKLGGGGWSRNCGVMDRWGGVRVFELGKQGKGKGKGSVTVGGTWNNK